MAIRKPKRTVHKLLIEVLPDGEYNKLYGVTSYAQWDDDTNTVSLRASRHGVDLYADFLHECKHAFVDLLDS